VIPILAKELSVGYLRLFVLSIFLFSSLALTVEATETNQPEFRVLPSDSEMLVLEFRFGQYILSDGLVSYLNPSGLYVPLGKIAEIIDFPISIDPEAKQAEGWFLSEDRRFFLDIPQRKVVVEGKSSTFDPNLVFLDSGNIFVNIILLGKWLPVDFRFDISQMLVKVSSEETLPFVAYLERQKAHARLKERGEAKVTYPYKANPYSILSWPTIDGSSDFDYVKDQTYTLNSSVRISGDFLYMNTELYGSGSKEDGLTNLRLNMGRRYPGSQLLGPLKVSEFSMGDIYSPQIPLITNSKSGAGFKISNFPLSKETEFDRINLRGILQIGWENSSPGQHHSCHGY